MYHIWGSCLILIDTWGQLLDFISRLGKTPLFYYKPWTNSLILLHTLGQLLDFITNHGPTP